VQTLNGFDATAAQLLGIKIYMSREKNHEQAMVFSIKERAGHLSARQRVGYAANALFRMLGLNDLDDDAPSSASPWAQNHGGDAQTSLMPVSISIGRRRHR
jgi:hypothetical protein